MTGSKYGYAGNILHVDLTTSKVCTELTENYGRKFLGGRGINQWILFKKLRPWVTPFEPANIICFGAGTLAGTLVPGAARLNIDSKNALTGGIGSANAGGWFASELKFAGYDNLVVHGKARKRIYLSIEDEVSIRSARELWGKNTSETIRAPPIFFNDFYHFLEEMLLKKKGNPLRIEVRLTKFWKTWNKKRRKGVGV